MKEDNCKTTYYPCLENDNGTIIESPNKTITDREEAIKWLESMSNRQNVKLVLKETKHIYFK